MNKFKVGDFVRVRPKIVTPGIREEYALLGLDIDAAQEVSMVQGSAVWVVGDKIHWVDNNLEKVKVVSDLDDML